MDVYTAVDLAVIVGLAVTDLMGYRPMAWTFGFLSVRTNINGWYFDASFREDHTSQLTKTKHPVQTGASLTDHSYMEPKRLVLDIGMSDVMGSYKPGQYPLSNKSVNAYQQFLKLQATRQPLTVQTRLYTYKNMLIDSIHASDDAKTTYALRATITLEEIIMATVATKTTTSNQSQKTDSTNSGSVQATPSDSPLSTLSDSVSPGYTKTNP